MQVVLGLGTNLGDRKGTWPGPWMPWSAWRAQSCCGSPSIYETDPFDVLSQQDNYLNCCVLLETRLKPQRGCWSTVWRLKRAWGGCG